MPVVSVVPRRSASVKASARASRPVLASALRAPFPATFSGPAQYGAGIKAYVLNLLIAQMISLKCVKHSIQSLIGQVISEATILKYALQLHLALERWEQLAIERCSPSRRCMWMRLPSASRSTITGSTSARQGISR